MNGSIQKPYNRIEHSYQIQVEIISPFKQSNISNSSPLSLFFFFLHLNQYSQKANIRKQLMFSFVQHKNCSFMQSKETIESNHLGERIHVKSISVRAAYRI